MFKSTKVKVVADEDGNILHQNPHSETHGSIRLQQIVVANNNGYLSVKRRTAFLTGEMDFMDQLIKLEGIVAGTELPGRIYIKETREPQWKSKEDDREQMCKINPETGCEHLVDGEKVYMKMIYDETGLIPDTLIVGEISKGKKITDPRPKNAVVIETSALSA
jgi:hypothetical protein